MGRRIVLTADQTLMSTYRDIPLLPFFSCAPAEKIPERLFYFLAPPVRSTNGVAPVAPYGLRKLEASLLSEYKRNEVVVCLPGRAEEFIDKNTAIVGVNSMDPLGAGPLSVMFCAGIYTSYSKKCFRELIDRLRDLREKKGHKFKIIHGGSGAWQFEARREKAEALGIDHVVSGEIDTLAPKIFQDIESGTAPQFTRVARGPKIEDVPTIVGPSIHGMIEVMRGCGRNCEFCEPNLRLARYVPLEKIRKEIEVNARGGIPSVWAHSEDIFLYKLEDKRDYIPNWDALYELFNGIMTTPGVVHCNPTHGTVAPAAADPDQFRRISEPLRAGPDHCIGIQAGLETGSGRLLHEYMPVKMKPFGPDEWGEVVINGTQVLNDNYWIPAYTLMLGLPGETDDDAWETLRLIDTMEKKVPRKVGAKAHFTITPMSFVPVGVMRKEHFFYGSMLSEAQLCVVYRSWKHTIKEVDSIAGELIRANPALKYSISMLFRFGSRLILSAVKRYADRLGYDVEKAYGQRAVAA